MLTTLSTIFIILSLDGKQEVLAQNSNTVSTQRGYLLTVNVPSHPFGKSTIGIFITTEDGYTDHVYIPTAGNPSWTFKIPPNQGNSVQVCVNSGPQSKENCHFYNTNGSYMSVSLPAISGSTSSNSGGSESSSNSSNDKSTSNNDNNKSHHNTDTSSNNHRSHTNFNGDNNKSNINHHTNADSATANSNDNGNGTGGSNGNQGNKSHGIDSAGSDTHSGNSHHGSSHNSDNGGLNSNSTSSTGSNLNNNNNHNAPIIQFIGPNP